MLSISMFTLTVTTIVTALKSKHSKNHMTCNTRIITLWARVIMAIGYKFCLIPTITPLWQVPCRHSKMVLSFSFSQIPWATTWPWRKSPVTLSDLLQLTGITAARTATCGNAIPHQRPILAMIRAATNEAAKSSSATRLY
jgi:hypothetical protein